MAQKKRPGRPKKQPVVTTEDHIPSVFRQGFEVERIDDLTCGEGPRFNASSCVLNGVRYTVYRTHVSVDEPGTLDSVIGIQSKELTGEGNTTDKILQINPHGSSSNYIDPRIFVHEGALYVSFSEKDFVNFPQYRVILRLIKLGQTLNQAQDYRIQFGNNYKGHEKNWMFFSHLGKIHFIYTLHDQRVARISNIGRPEREWTGKKIHWNMDFLRGGSPLIPYGDNYIGFYHSATDHPWQLRRYGMGAVEIEGKEPFGIRRLSLPFMFGSRHDDWCGMGNQNCIFVSGVEDGGDDVVAISGVNDTFNARIRVPKEKLEELLLPAERFLSDHGRCFSITGGKPVRTVFGTEVNPGTLVGLSGYKGPTYYHKTDDPYFAQFAETANHVEEIPLEQYEAKVSMVKAKINHPPSRRPEYLKKRLKSPSEQPKPLPQITSDTPITSETLNKYTRKPVAQSAITHSAEEMDSISGAIKQEDSAAITMG